MSNEKALDPDGIPVEFYKLHVEWISKDLWLIYNESMECGSLGSEINARLIKLIPKDGDITLIKNWRPITLLSLLQNISQDSCPKLKDILPKVINSTQTCFVKGRYILENLITYWEAIE